MRAVVWPSRIEIEGVRLLPHETWEKLLDELKAEEVQSSTRTGKRMSVAIGPTGRMDAFIYRTKPMAEEEIIRILGKYDIVARVGSTNAAFA